MLMSVIDSVREGKVAPEDANSIAKVAAQINQSLKIEIEARTASAALSQVALGSMPIGEEE
jgi:hypothetical protein